MRRIRVLEDAFDEASAAATWYEKERRGLGTEFFQAIEAGLDLIQDDILPLLPISHKTNFSIEAKRLILKRFPFDIITIERQDEIIVIAIAHHSRKPGYWKDRIDP